MDRWELLSLVTGLRKELGLADRDVMVLRAHLSVMPHGPLDPAGLNISFMSITNILERACGMDERRFRRGETRLEQAGLIRRRLSGNGRRFPERDKSGRVVNAYGIDLAPLLASFDDLLAMADWRAEQDRVARTRRNSISARLSAAVRTVMASNGALPDWVDALRDRLRKAVRRKSIEAQEFDAIETEIARLEALTSVYAKAQIYPGDRHSAEVVPDKCPGDDGQTVRHIESKPKDIKKTNSHRFDENLLASLWADTKTLQQFYPECPRQEQTMIKAIIDFCSFMALERDIVIRTLSVLGWEKAIVTLDYLAEKLPSLNRPHGYLLSMIDRYEKGQAIAGGQVTAEHRPLIFA